MPPPIDTNILSGLLRRQPDPRVLAWAESQPGFMVSVASLEELLFGLIQKNLPPNRRWLDGFQPGTFHRTLQILSVHPFATVPQILAELASDIWNAFILTI